MRQYRYLFAGYEAVITSKYFNSDGNLVYPTLEIIKTSSKKGPINILVLFAVYYSVAEAKNKLAETMNLTPERLKVYRVPK